MITVRREWLAKDSKAFEALANAKAYRENFDPSSSWRIMKPGRQDDSITHSIKPASFKRFNP